MKVLVTGAGGFVGKPLCEELAAKGHQVEAVVRPGKRCRFTSPSIRALPLDLSHLDPAHLPKGVDAVFTLAQSARFREFPAKSKDILDVNVTANHKLFDWAVQSGVKRFVHVSSGGIYGGRVNGILRESDPLAVDSPLGFYLGTKLCAEILFQNYRHFLETAVILRPFFIYGPGQRKDMFIPRLVESVGSGRPIRLQGEDGLRVNPVFVDDAVQMVADSLILTGCHIINVAGPDILTLRQIGESIGSRLGKEPRFERVEGEPVDYVGNIDESKARFGLALTPFEEGLKRTVGCR